MERTHKRRVVITGMGVVSSLGNNVDTFYENLLEGKSGAKKIEHFDTTDYTTTFAASIPSFSWDEYLDKKVARRIDPFVAYAWVATKNALKQAQLPTCRQEEGFANYGVLIGSGMGGMSTFGEGVDVLLNKGPKRISPFFVPYIISNMASAHIAMELGYRGPNYSISTACATSNHSLIAAANHIMYGDADVMLAGGVEASVVPIGLAGFCGCRALSTRNDAPEKASRPFDKARDGFVLGEGAGVLVLEELEHARRRNAPILAEYLGGAFTCDAHHMTEPHPEGIGVMECIQKALLKAAIPATRVNYINAHATSTPIGDVAELNALQKVFSQRNDIYINATKSMIGHALGAAGGIEAVATIMAILTGEVHPTINLEDPEESLIFNYSEKRKKWPIDVALSNSFGFGGHNSSILIGKWS